MLSIIRQIKRAIFVAACLLHLSCFIFGQTITQYEYWFDADYAHKSAVTTSTGTVTINTDLDVTALSEGLHRFHFRARDNQGAWSAPLTHFFFFTPTNQFGRTMVQYQYWFDADDAQKQTVAATGNTVTIDMQTDVTALSEGLHRFHFRAQDSQGAWSAPLTHFFYRVPKVTAANKIVRYEYWFDTNDAAKQTVDASDNPVMVDMSLDVLALTPGTHILYFRSLDSQGAWSAPMAHAFTRTKMDYEIDKTITSIAGTGGTIAPLGVVKVNHGGNQTFTVTPNTGYGINQVLVDGENKTADVVDGKYTFANVIIDHTISVSFYKKSTDATLSALSITGYSILPAFSSSVTAYTLTVPNSVSSIVINAVATHANAVVDGTDTKTLTVGQNICTITVTAEDGVTKKNYTVTVTRSEPDKTITASAGEGGTISPEGSVPVSHGGSKTFTFIPNTGYKIDKVLIDGVNNTGAVGTGSYTFTNVTTDHTISVSFTKKSTDATLSALSITGYTLSPAFDANVTGYALVVPNGVSSVMINAVTAQANAVVAGTGAKTLTVGQNVYTITVSAEDGVTQKVYTITITRAEAEKTITATVGTGGTITPSGTVKVGHGGNQTFTMTPNTGYEINQVLVDNVNNTAAVNSGSYTFTNVTTDHTISVSFYKKSTDATLSALSVSGYTLSPAFGSGVASYTLTVPNSVSSIVINATTAYANAVVTGTGTKTLMVGQNICTITVTAEDGVTKKTYTITITRSETDKTITATAEAGGTIAPSGAVKVGHGGSQKFTMTPNTGYAIHQVLVDGVNNTAAVSSGSYTFSNVTADHTISVSFKEKKSDDATLSSLSVTGYTLSPAFGPGVVSYTLTVPNGTSSVVINATAAHANAVVTGIGTKTLTVGQNVCPVTVTAEDGVTKKTYTITITRSEADKIITATAGTGGTISPSGKVTVGHGGNQSFTITPNTGYSVDQVLVDGVNNTAAVNSGSYTFLNVTANHTIEARFRSSRTDLSDIEVPSGGRLSPIFSRSNTAYRILLDCGQNEATVKFSTVYASASVVADGKRLTAGIAVFSQTVPGQRTIAVTVEDGTATREYAITLIRPFDHAVTPVWSDVLSVINNPANNGGYTFTQYQWYSDQLLENMISGQTSANVQVADNSRTNYTVWLETDNGTASYGCVRNASKQAFSVKAYPNPTSDKVVVEMENREGECLMELRNMLGTLLQKKKITAPLVEVNMYGLPPGVYLLTIDDITIRIIKE